MRLPFRRAVRYARAGRACGARARTVCTVLYRTLYSMYGRMCPYVHIVRMAVTSQQTAAAADGAGDA